MNKYTDGEIVEKLSQILGNNEDNYSWLDHQIEVLDNTPELVRVKISQMYEYVSISFGDLLMISQFFGTQQIGDTRYSSSGCETCDYGSSYEITLRITPETA